LRADEEVRAGPRSVEAQVDGVRRREVGLRLALGALRSQIVDRFVFEGLTVSLLGCLAGFGLAFEFTRALSGMLYGVSANDKETFFLVLLTIVGAIALASLLLALRAASVEPMLVLREE
jgi:ABC-type antimicrobial peptide transport system permease subunit